MSNNYTFTGDGNLRPDLINDIRDEIRRNTDRLKKHGLDPTVYADADRTELFIVKTGDEWMKQEYGKPMPRRLFGDLWLEHELCIMFADTNMGKSVLAVQIGASLAKRDHIQPFANELTDAARVLYVDFELTAKQFELRYRHPLVGSRNFGHTFFRAEMNPGADNPALYRDRNSHLITSLRRAVESTRATILIIDNLTCVHSSTDRAAGALALMQQLKALKTTHKLSILALAHTPKRNPAKPLTVNDLQGSKMLINFADSAFAIGQSLREPALRYLKQIKQRSMQQAHGAGNVCLARMQKDHNYLHYQFEGTAAEYEHLQDRTRAQLQQQAMHLHRQGQTYREIAAQLNTSPATVSRLIARAIANSPAEEA